MAKIIQLIIKNWKYISFILPYIIKVIKSIYLKIKIKRTMEKLGIELTEDLTKDIAVLIKTGAIAYSDDKRISKAEWIGIVMKSIPVLTDLTKAKQIIAEVRDFDTEEGKQYIEYLLTLGIVKDKAAEVARLITDYVQYQITGYELYVLPIIEAFKK